VAGLHFLKPLARCPAAGFFSKLKAWNLGNSMPGGLYRLHAHADSTALAAVSAATVWIPRGYFANPLNN
jgi:hypothetical protein